MKIAAHGGPQDGAEVIVPQHIAAGQRVDLEGAHYELHRPHGAAPRLDHVKEA